MMRKAFFFAILVVGLIYGIVFSLMPLPTYAQPVISCTLSDTEPHPLRPYPGQICGPEAQRTIDQTDKPYCAMRPWSAKDITFMKNMEDCTGTKYAADNYPCLLREFRGIYEIDLTQYELPLVSITRNGSELTYFNRAQEHVADYLEGRAYYEGLVEPEPDETPEWYALWNRLGVFRKLANLKQQDDLKKENVQRALPPGTIHNYIVGYRSGNNQAPWGFGSPVRMTQFDGNYPPEYTCENILDAAQKRACIDQYYQDRYNWEQTIYGKLWASVPMFTREDAIGFVQVNPEPLQYFDPVKFSKMEIPLTNPVSLPHLPRLNAVSTALQSMLSSRVREAKQAELAEETDPNLGISCPAGPWASETSYYNACVRGDLCNLGQAFYSPGDYALDSTLEFVAKHAFSDPENPKVVPQSYYEEYKDFVCRADGCIGGTSTTYCASWDVDHSEDSAIRHCPLPNCRLSSCQQFPPNRADGEYCEVGSQRYCDIYGWSICLSNGSWSPLWIGFLVPTGTCFATPPYETRRCSGGKAGEPGSGSWVTIPDVPEEGRCEEMLTPLKIAFTPGYVLTFTPYLRSIWENTVHQVQAIFTPFRTAINKNIYDWPGESLISYAYPDQYAEAGAPPGTVPGSMAKIYFRYLGYIHCAKENLLNKLAPLLYDIPYVYYDARCNAELW